MHMQYIYMYMQHINIYMQHINTCAKQTPAPRRGWESKNRSTKQTCRTPKISPSQTAPAKISPSQKKFTLPKISPSHEANMSNTKNFTIPNSACNNLVQWGSYMWSHSTWVLNICSHSTYDHNQHMITFNVCIKHMISINNVCFMCVLNIWSQSTYATYSMYQTYDYNQHTQRPHQICVLNIWSQ